VYVAPSLVHGTAVVFVFLTWNATGSDFTVTALEVAADGTQRATAAERAAHVTATRILPERDEAPR
jgi:hypothetical protein